MSSQSILHMQDHDLNAVQTNSPIPSASLLHLLNSIAHQITSHHYYPRFDIDEYPTSYELYGDLPGCQQETLKIATLDDHTIEISGSTVRHSHGEGEDPTTTSTSPNEGTKSSERPATGPLESMLHIVNSESSKSAANSQSGVPVLNGKPTETATVNDTNLIDGGELTKVDEHSPEEPHSKAKNKAHHIQTERQSGSFHRTFPFTNSILEKEVSARFADGVLHISVPKGPERERNHVQVYWGSIF